MKKITPKPTDSIPEKLLNKVTNCSQEVSWTSPKEVKQKLIQLYHQKCAYCEQSVEYLEIEHFRPQKKYPWLTYSWDNLLPVCRACNGAKSMQFPIENEPVSCNETDLANIHFLTPQYNRIEGALLLHPEYDEEVEHGWIFNIVGEIAENQISNKKILTAIRTCKLNRQTLVEQRNRVVKELVEKLRDIIHRNHSDKEKAKRDIYSEIDFFIKKSQQDRTDFTIFRKYIIKIFLRELLLKELL
jgi:uncharacterized protein (TIGR02646 family)